MTPKIRDNKYQEAVREANRKAMADLSPSERVLVQRAISNVRGIHNCGLGRATEIVAALGRFLVESEEG